MTERGRDTGRHRGVGLFVFLLVLCGGALLAAATLYVQHGDPLLRRLDASVGEMLMRYGEDAESAGNTAAAIGYYTVALDTRFEGPQNRAHTHLRLGVLLLETGQPALAEHHLRSETSGAYTLAETRERHCEALLALEDTEALAPALEAWEAGAANDKEHARAAWYRGRLEALRGDEAAALEAYELGAELDPASPCAVELAKSDAERRTELLSAFLLHGGVGEAAREARAMLAEEM